MIEDDITDIIIKDNVRVVEEKYLIFYVIDVDGAIRPTCYGTIESLPTGQNAQERMSVSSTTIMSTTEKNGSEQETL